MVCIFISNPTVAIWYHSPLWFYDLQLLICHSSIQESNTQSFFAAKPCAMQTPTMQTLLLYHSFANKKLLLACAELTSHPWYR